MSELKPSYETNDPDAMRRILVSLATIFNANLNPVKFALYRECLSDLDIEAVRVAAMEHMKYGKSFPLPADLRERVNGVPTTGATKEVMKPGATPVTDFVGKNEAASPLDVFNFMLDHMFSNFKLASPEVEIAVINAVSELTRSWLCQRT